MLFPVREQDLSKCRYTSAFGIRTHPITKKQDMHRGIDIAMPSGTPLIALGDGVVTVSKVNNGGATVGLGYYLVIKYDNGLYSLYAHLRELPKVKVGQRVKQGDIVASSGNTGSSTGPHLHFEIHKDGLLFKSQVTNKDTAIDPLTYYPELKGLLGKYLTNVSFKKEVEEDMKFKEKWQEELFIATVNSLASKKKIHNREDWLNKYNSGKLTAEELALLALAVADRV